MVHQRRVVTNAAVRDRTGHDANAALGRRSWLRAANKRPALSAWALKSRTPVRGRTGQAAFLRSARAGPSAKAGWRQVKVFSQVFFKKLARCGAELHGLNRRAGGKVQRTGRTALVPSGHRSALTEPAGETAGDSPGSGRGGTTRGGHTSPLFLKYGKAVASPPHPCKVLGFHPKPHKPFEKGLSENFTCLSQTQARAFGPAALRKPRRLKAPFASCPVRPRTPRTEL